MHYCKTIPHTNVNHHVVYVFNKHRNVIDVLDSKDWPRQSKTETARSEFHAADIKEIVSLYFVFSFILLCFLFFYDCCSEYSLFNRLGGLY
jgi:mannosyltransferase OCH1-like enzyme